MPVDVNEMIFRFSGGTSNTDKDLSYGGDMSSTAGPTDNTLHNLFDRVSGAENAANTDEVRCLYILNTDASITAENVRLWVESETTHTGEDVEIALDLAGLNGTADTVTDAYTLPSPPVSWTDASGVGSAIAVGNIPAGQKYAFWIKRNTNNAAAYNDYTTVLKIDWDTAAQSHK